MGTKPKEITFGWCLSNKHDECRMRYGDNIVCICNCSNHGEKRKEQNKKNEQQVKEVIERINAANAGSGTTRSDWTRDGVLYPKSVVSKPNLDADTIEELERRRRQR